MEARYYYHRLLFLVLGALLLLLFTRSGQVLHLSQKAEFLLDCTLRNSPFCAAKDRILSQPSSIAAAAAGDHEYDEPNHPLDPLTIKEMNAARSIVLAHSPFSSSPQAVAFHSLALDEPDKSLVLAWRRGDPLPPRQALAIVLFKRTPFSLSVDLASSAVDPRPVPASGFPTMTIDDMIGAALAPLADKEFNRSVLARGVRLSDLVCLPISSGWFGRETSRRLIKVQCYSSEGTANFYMRPIEGLTVLVDLDSKEVVEISDVGLGIPVPKSTGTDYRYDNEKNRRKTKIGAVNPISMEQPAGRSFEVAEGGHTVRWAGWELHLKADARAGVVVSEAVVIDPESGERRRVMYR